MVKFRCCYKCPDRHVLCHDGCLRYQNEKAKIDEYKKKVNKVKRYESMMCEVKSESVNRIRKRSHNRG